MSLQLTTIELDEIRARLLSRPATVTNGELLGVVVGRGARRKPGTEPSIHRTAVEVGRAILAEAGGLAGFVRTADDTLLERDGVGQGLASLFVATAEVAARYHRDPEIVDDPTLPARTPARRATREDDAVRRLFRDRLSALPVPRVAAPRRRYTYRGHSPRRPATSAEDARRREDATHCGRGTSRKNGESFADSGSKHAQSRIFDQC